MTSLVNRLVDEGSGKASEFVILLWNLAVKVAASSVFAMRVGLSQPPPPPLPLPVSRQQEDNTKS